MNLTERNLLVMRRLASMPFLDRLELAAVSGTPDRSTYEAMDSLERSGLAASILHATDLLRSTRRYHLTVSGLRRLAEADGAALGEILREYPVSAQWRRILMERLDAVGVIYRLASSIAAETGPIRMRWYRAAPLDAAVELADGRTLGIVRQGLTSDRTGFSKRLYRLGEGPLPGAVLMLMPDEVRLRHARKTLTNSHVPAVLSLERDAAWANPSETVWRLPSVAAALDLRYVLSSYLEPGGRLITEPEPSRATFPDDFVLGGPGMRTPDWLLPALLKPAEKRVLDLLFDWPGIAPDDLRRLLGVSRGRFYEIVAPLSKAGLVRRVVMEGPPVGAQRPGVGATGPEGPHLRGRGQEAVERLAHRPKRSHRVAQRLRQEEPPAAQEPRSHGGGPRFRCGAGEAGPLSGLGSGAA